MIENIILFESHKKLYSKYFPQASSLYSLSADQIKYHKIELFLAKVFLLAAFKYLFSILRSNKKNYFNELIEFTLAKEFDLILALERRNIIFIGSIRYKPYGFLYNRLISMLNDSLSRYFTDINIVLQGAGNIQNELQVLYSDNVTSLFLPSPKQSVSEDKIDKFYQINKAKLHFIQENFSLLCHEPSSKNIVIFHGYDKRKRLYPYGLYELIKIMIIIGLVNRMTNQARLIFLLHPRISYIYPFFNLLLNLKLSNNSILFCDLDHLSFEQKVIEYSKIYSFSPTVTSNLMHSGMPNVFFELGKDCTSSNILEILGK